MSDDAVRTVLKPFADEMADVIKKHLRACPGFSFHPVFIDAAAYEPMIDVLEKAIAAHRAHTLAGAGEVERKLRSPIVTKSIGPGVRNAVKAMLMKDAADLIAAQREEIIELKCALKPFALNAESVGSLSDDVVIGLLGGSAKNSIAVGDLRRARAALGRDG